MTFSDLLRVVPGSPPDLASIDTSSTPGFDGDRDAARDRLKDPQWPEPDEDLSGIVIPA